MDYQSAFYAMCVTSYLLVALIVWFIFVNDPFQMLSTRKYIWHCIGCLLWPVIILVGVIDGWINRWE